VYTARKDTWEQPLTDLFSLDAKTFEKEWAFLCACASPAPLSAERLDSLTANLDWDLTLELAAEHSILGIVAARLKETGFLGAPADAREKLQERLRAQLLFTLSMTAELFRILG